MPQVDLAHGFDAGDRDIRGGYGEGRFGDKKMGPGGDFNPEFQRVSHGPRFKNLPFCVALCSRQSCSAIGSMYAALTVLPTPALVM